MDTFRLRLESVPRSLAFVLAAVLLLTLIPLAAPARAEIEIQPEEDGLALSIRFAGENRYDTAEDIATDTTEFAPDFSGDTVILATGERFPDALAGSTLGGLENAPIVLTPRFLDDDGSLFDDTEQALVQIDPANIFILGETEAISEEVAGEVTDLTGVAPVRIGGQDRYETAALIADETAPPETATAIVARGTDFPDALVSGAIAAAADLPLLLTEEDELNDFAEERLQSLGIERVILAGGVVAISQEVEDQIEELGIEVERVFGMDRFDTAAAFAEQAVEFAELGTDRFGFGRDHVNLARGDVFADAVALGPHAGLDYTGPSPILLALPETLTAPTAEFFDDIASCDFDSLHVAGGVLAISEDVENEAREILRPDTCTDDDATIDDITPLEATNDVGEPHDVTVTLVDAAGDAADGVDVDFAVTGAPAGATPPDPQAATVTTGADGTATFTFIGFEPGDYTVTATVTGADGTTVADTAVAAKTFIDPTVTPAPGPQTLFGITGAASATGEPLDPGATRLVETSVDPDAAGAGGLTLGDQFLVVDPAGNPLPVDLVALEAVNPLYALGEDGQLFTIETSTTTTIIDPVTGLPVAAPGDVAGIATATPVGPAGDFGGPLGTLNGRGVGFDYNESAGAFRVVTEDGDNFRVSETGTVTADPALAYRTTDPAAPGAAPGVTGAAYTINSVLYDIDTENGLLVIQAPPSSGQLSTVAPLTLDGDLVVDPLLGTTIANFNGFEIDRQSNEAYVALTLTGPGAVTDGVFLLDLGTGVLTQVGNDLVEAFNGIAIEFPPAP
jgi:putative cell wall-binding protein